MSQINLKYGFVRLGAILISVTATYCLGGERYSHLFERLPFLLIFDPWGFFFTVACYCIVLIDREPTAKNKIIAFGFSALVPTTINFLDPLRGMSNFGPTLIFGQMLIPLCYSSVIFVSFFLGSSSQQRSTANRDL